MKASEFKETLATYEKRPCSLGELLALYDTWKQIFRAGAYGHQESYDVARDTRSWFEQGKWLKVEEGET